MNETYLWSHEPFISAPPAERLKHQLYQGPKNEIDEIAVFKLENDKFLYIRFYGTKTDLNLGFTDIEEFDNLQEAVKLYNSMFLTEENNDQKQQEN